jgi:hypothetical protein
MSATSAEDMSMSDGQRVPVGVRFKEAGKVYYFDAGEYSLDVGN